MAKDERPMIALRPAKDRLPADVDHCLLASLEALTGLSAKDQLEAACRGVLAVLIAARARFERDPEGRVAFDLVCEDVTDWLRQEIGALRFIRPS